jgi:putative Holliday junction resolvase
MGNLMREPHDGRQRSLVGLDVGNKWVGVAHSDPSFTLAYPGDLLKRNAPGGDEGVKETLRNLINEEGACGMVVGWPVEMSGKQGGQCDKVFQFLKDMDILLPIVLVDERLTSKVISDVLHQTHIKKRKHKTVIDNMAATYILQNFLDETVDAPTSDRTFVDLPQQEKIRHDSGQRQRKEKTRLGRIGQRKRQEKTHHFR